MPVFPKSFLSHARVPALVLLLVFGALTLNYRTPTKLHHRENASTQPSRPLNITILTVSDDYYKNKYRSHIKSIRCYANYHNYSYIILNPKTKLYSPCKDHRDYYFLKHCAVALFLENHPQVNMAVVLDGDVVSFNPTPLSHWIQPRYDLVFYERSWNSEITSGNYIVSNNEFTRYFLRYWSGFEFTKPVGFSSSDNGAIHLALIDALGMKGRQVCQRMYSSLTASVNNLEPYYNFVACTKHLLGPARVFKRTALLPREESIDVTIAVYPRFFGPAVDSAVFSVAKDLNVHPFFHGLKDRNWFEGFGLKNDSQLCRTHVKPRVTQADKGSEALFRAELRHGDENNMHKKDLPMALVPRWSQLNDSCYETFCYPLESLKNGCPKGFVHKNGQLEVIEYVNPGIDKINSFWTKFKKGTVMHDPEE